ncbi:MAG: acyl carrier protein [Bacteroidota bacterium]|nr:acyl carrier protein [Bacteroidota bacterium]
MHKNIQSELQSVFRKAFENNSIVISGQTTANDIYGWDSLTHMTLINDIEQHFKVEFSFNEVSSFNCVDDMIKCIAEKKLKR